MVYSPAKWQKKEKTSIPGHITTKLSNKHTLE